MCNNEFEDSCNFEVNVKALVSNISFATLIFENSEFDAYVKEMKDIAKQDLVREKQSKYQALYDKWQDDMKVLDI